MHYSTEDPIKDGRQISASALRAMAEQAALAATLNLGDGYTVSTTAGQVLVQPPAATTSTVYGLSVAQAAGSAATITLPPASGNVQFPQAGQVLRTSAVSGRAAPLTNTGVNFAYNAAGFYLASCELLLTWTGSPAQTGYLRLGIEAGLWAQQLQDVVVTLGALDQFYVHLGPALVNRGSADDFGVVCQQGPSGLGTITITNYVLDVLALN